MLNNPLKNPLKEDKMGAFIFKSKRVRKGSVSNLFSYSFVMLSVFVLILYGYTLIKFIFFYDIQN